MKHTVLHGGVPIAAFDWADAEVSTHRIEDMEFTRVEVTAETLPGYEAISEVVEGGWRAMRDASYLRPIAQPDEWDRNTLAQLRLSELQRELELVDAGGLPMAAGVLIFAKDHPRASEGGFVRLSVVLGDAPAAVPARLAPAAPGGRDSQGLPDRA